MQDLVSENRPCPGFPQQKSALSTRFPQNLWIKLGKSGKVPKIGVKCRAGRSQSAALMLMCSVSDRTRSDSYGPAVRKGRDIDDRRTIRELGWTEPGATATGRHSGGTCHASGRYRVPAHHFVRSSVPRRGHLRSIVVGFGTPEPQPIIVRVLPARRSVDFGRNALPSPSRKYGPIRHTYCTKPFRGTPSRSTIAQTFISRMLVDEQRRKG